MNKQEIKKNYKYIIYFLVVIIILLLGFISGFYFSKIEKEKKEVAKVEKNISNTKEALKVLSKLVEKEDKSKNKDIVKKDANISSEINDYKNALKTHKKQDKREINNIELSLSNNKPKLVIILDDISSKSEVIAIKKIPFTVTPSFFPPTKRHPYTPIYAKEFKSYMVHLPLQAIHFSNEEESTLHTGDSYKIVKNRIANIKKWFPDDVFLNNHTGSKFTSSYNDMKNLYKALSFYNINFLDSRTTPITQAPKISKLYHKQLFSRNIFLDNIQDEKIIKQQIIKAIKIAKKRGFAIAIGHPHKSTLNALYSSKKLLKDVEVISINKLNELNKNNKLSGL